MTFSLITPDGLPPFYRADTLATPHGFFTAAGGVSTGVYDALNCGFGSDDDPALVRQNRALAAHSLGLDPLRLAGVFQVHGAQVLTLTQPTAAMQARAAGHPDAMPLEQADGLVTREPGLGLAILTADCLPVLFADLQAGVVGACHAGWRGAVGGVVEATVAAMRAAGAHTITALIGPTIRQPSYQVGADMRTAVMSAPVMTAPTGSALDPDAVAACFIPDPDSTTSDEKYRFDLAAYVKLRLACAAVSDCADCGLDTYPLPTDGDESPSFFSHRRATHRREPDSGRLISIISLG